MTDDWVVTVSYPRTVTLEEIDAWETLLAPFDAMVSQIPALGLMELTVYSPGGADIVGTVDQIVAAISAAIDVPPPVAIEIVRESEYQRRAYEPTMPELMATAEIADELGVSRQRVHQLRSVEGFPAPLMDLLDGSAWDAQAIRKFSSEWSGNDDDVDLKREVLHTRTGQRITDEFAEAAADEAEDRAARLDPRR